MSPELASIATLKDREIRMWLRCSSARAGPSQPQPLLRVAGRARVSIQLLSVSDVQVRCSLQNQPLTVDAELDTRLALRSAKSSMVYERTGTAICNGSSRIVKQVQDR